jgi:hypothetical protein
MGNLYSITTNQAVSIGSWERLMQTRGVPVAGGEINASGVYGGENALAKNFEFKLDKKAIFELMAPNLL